jgi:hypothetical protein
MASRTARSPEHQLMTEYTVSHSRFRDGQKPCPESWGKQCFAVLTRTLRESSILFSGIVNTFRTLQRVGINVSPNHFYWPIPDLAELEKRDWSVYAQPPGCGFQLRKQSELAHEFAGSYMAECNFDSCASDDLYHYGNGYFESCDAEVAYCMVRHSKPRRIIEIGAGYSTRIMATALRENAERDGITGQLITVDPSPKRLPRNGLGKFVYVVTEPVQHLDLRLFSLLQPNDILFIDSSHVVGVGSDVAREYLEILPALNPGVLVHLHDIFLPSDYPREAVLKNLCFWSEQYLLQAFLSFNTEFEVMWAASAMQTLHPQTLQTCFPSWQHSYRDMAAAKRRFLPTIDGDRIWPSSFWMRRVQHL